MEALKFKNPVFQPGLNLTVRLGRKWYHNFQKQETRNWVEDSLKLLQEHKGKTLPSPPGFHAVPVNLEDAEGNPLGNGKIEFVYGTCFNDVNAAWLEFEHDDKCKTLKGLYEVMREVYGDEFHFGSEVTLVFFTVD